jgi:hypothetical protein
MSKNKKRYETDASKKAGIILEITDIGMFESYCFGWFKLTNEIAKDWDGWYINKELKLIKE